jgi:hypothetical protein
MLRKKDMIEVAECINGSYIFPSDKKALQKATVITGLSSTLYPTAVFAQSSDTFNMLFDGIMKLVDAGVVLVIIFAGSAWILHNRTRAMTIMMGVSGGYLIIRNAIHIRNFLKSLVPDMGEL